jgi:hypothetical protein
MSKDGENMNGNEWRKDPETGRYLSGSRTDQQCLKGIFNRCEVVDSGCWEFRGGLGSTGYGQVTYQGRPWKASRLIYKLAMGPVDGMLVCHHCDNRKCCNPEHLFLGTHTDNIRDAMRKGRFKGRPPQKLTAELVLEIRASSETNKVLGRKYGVDPSCISRIKSRKLWPNV